MSENKNDSLDFSNARNIMGLLGTIFAILFFIAPISLMIKLHKKQIDPLKTPYFIMMMNNLNCVLWLSYGLLISDFFIILANGIGISVNVIYFCLYFFYRLEKKIMKTLLVVLITLTLTGGILVILTYVIKINDLSRYSAVVINVLMYAAPGQKMVKYFFNYKFQIEVCKTKDYTLIPLPSVIMGIFCSSCWLLYGILPISDISIIIPNGLGNYFF